MAIDVGGYAMSLLPTSNIGSLFGTIFRALLWGSILGIIGMFGFILWRSAQKKRLYNYLVEIYYQEPGSQAVMKKLDFAGVFTKKKTGLKRLYLMKHNVGLNPDNVPFIFTEKGKRLVTLWQSGLKNFRFVNPTMTSNPGFVMNVGEEDVNWAIASYHEWKERLQFQDWLQKHGHILLWSITIVGSLFIMWFITSKFDVMGGIAQAMLQAAQALRDASAGTVVK